jgi:exodeoxyribonuclease VII small subunit
MMPEHQADIADLSFEAAFAELEDVVRRLEAGELTLEASLALFERGQALASFCQGQLDVAELKVQQLLSTTGGDLRTVDLEPLE